MDCFNVPTCRTAAFWLVEFLMCALWVFFFFLLFRSRMCLEKVDFCISECVWLHDWVKLPTDLKLFKSSLCFGMSKWLLLPLFGFIFHDAPYPTIHCCRWSCTTRCEILRMSLQHSWIVLPAASPAGQMTKLFAGESHVKRMEAPGRRVPTRPREDV